jgi:hypothetical protein
MSENGVLGLTAAICWLVGLCFFYFDVIPAGIVFWFVTLYIVNIVLIPQWFRRR